MAGDFYRKKKVSHNLPKSLTETAKKEYNKQWSFLTNMWEQNAMRDNKVIRKGD